MYTGQSQSPSLSKQYDFPIIPYNDPVAIAAGYTIADQQAQVFSGPVFDEERFYYCVYAGGIFFTFKNSLLVCRRKKDGSLVYVKNTNDYNLDTGATFMRPSSAMLVRTKPVIKGDRLYLTSGWITNIGPQLFCIDKRTGTKIYSIAYDPPAVVRQALGVQFINSPQDYSIYKGSNVLVSDLDAVVEDGKIYVGASSLQNVFNPGLVPGTTYYIGYPFFTDKGSLTVIKEFYNTATVQSQAYTCVRDVSVNDVLTTTDPELDPFIPGTTDVLIGTIAPLGTSITSPGAIQGLYYFAQRVSAPALPVALAPFWSLIGAQITLTAPNVTAANLTLAQALALINSNPGIVWTLTTSLADPSSVTGTTSSGMFAVWYIKELHEGDTVENVYDANGLGYFGCSVWGSEPLVGCGRVTFGTGQNHSIPVSERLQFSPDDMNYRALKRRLVDLSVQYSAAPSASLLFQLNQEKERFLQRIRELAIADIRSPRGQRSYVDAIVSSSIETGEIKFGVRSVPSDTYNFLGAQDPVVAILPTRQDIDGDLSSSVFQEGEQVTATSKNGGILTLDLTHWCERSRWTHSYPQSVGINVEPIVYSGSNGSLGGTIYVSVVRTRCDVLHLLALSSNDSSAISDGSTGTGGIGFEKFVSKHGEYIPTGLSYAYSYNQNEGCIEWNTRLLGTAYGNVAISGDLLFCNDNEGHLYLLSAKTGQVLQTINSGAAHNPMRGGIASPAIDRRSKQVFWIASYDAPGRAPTAGAYGWVLHLK